MGYKPWEVKKLTLKDFNLALTGYMARQHREWDRTRHIMSYVATFGGMGSKEFVRPENIYPLPQDVEQTKRKITNAQEANELLKDFE